MSEWYIQQIVKKLATIKDEEFLKRMYVIINNHNEKEAQSSFQTVDKVPVFAGTFTMSTVFLV